MRYVQLASRARRIKCFLHIYVHAASSDALAARMYVSSIELNCLVHKDSFSFLHLLVWFNVIADNTRNDYVAEGTSLKTCDFESSWIQHTSGAVCMVIEDSFNL